MLTTRYALPDISLTNYGRDAWYLALERLVSLVTIGVMIARREVRASPVEQCTCVFPVDINTRPDSFGQIERSSGGAPEC
jgi:hypothetical protein